MPEPWGPSAPPTEELLSENWSPGPLSYKSDHSNDSEHLSVTPVSETVPSSMEGGIGKGNHRFPRRTNIQSHFDVYSCARRSPLTPSLQSFTPTCLMSLPHSHPCPIIEHLGCVCFRDSHNGCSFKPKSPHVRPLLIGFPWFLSHCGPPGPLTPALVPSVTSSPTLSPLLSLLQRY